MTTTQGSLLDLVRCMTTVNQKTESNAKFNLFTFAVRANFDLLYFDYMRIMTECNDAFLKHVKKDEHGKPLEKARLVSLNKQEMPPKQFDFEDEEAYKKEVNEIYDKEIDVQVLKYEIKELLECKISFADNDSFIILKNIAL